MLKTDISICPPSLLAVQFLMRTGDLSLSHSTLQTKSADYSYKIKPLCFSVICCAGFGSDRINFFNSSLYGLWFFFECAGSSAGNTDMFLFLLSSAYTEA